jgi:hypothetical protein
MTGLPENIETLLDKLTENSRGELDLIRTLSDAIRRVDDQLLREIRSVSVAHEIRREAIVGELQTLANRLCALPVRTVNATPQPAISQSDDRRHASEVPNSDYNGNGADWRQATQNIGDDDEFSFDMPSPRH